MKKKKARKAGTVKNVVAACAWNKKRVFSAPDARKKYIVVDAPLSAVLDLPEGTRVNAFGMIGCLWDYIHKHKAQEVFSGED